jgi:hypothetical protein
VQRIDNDYDGSHAFYYVFCHVDDPPCIFYDYSCYDLCGNYVNCCDYDVLYDNVDYPCYDLYGNYVNGCDYDVFCDYVDETTLGMYASV